VGDAEQHLRDHQTEQLVIGDQRRTAAPRPPGRRKQRAGSATECNHEGVEVGAYVGLQVDGALATPTFDTLGFGPYMPVAASAVNVRSSI
jgi:hypothetical protein